MNYKLKLIVLLILIAVILVVKILNVKSVVNVKEVSYCSKECQKKTGKDIKMSVVKTHLFINKN